MTRTLSIAAASLLLVASVGEAAAQGTRFLRQPSVSADHIAFVHANDVWVVGRDGGQARRLTSDEGAETNPAFSPDGRWIAFSGEYGGNVDVYVVPTRGGQPVRLTWHPGADVVQGWTPSGQVLFQSGRESQPTRLWRFYTVSAEGGFPEPLPVHQAYLGEMSDDGRMLAYQEIGYWDPEWRNYRGGQAQPVRVVSLDDLELTNTPWEGERHMDPTWMDGVVYYMSERDYASNVWSFDPATGQDRQVTYHADFDVKSLDAGHGVVVYEQAGYLHELDPATGDSRQLEIDAAGDKNWARPRWEDVSAAQLTNPQLSPNGKRALFEVRGEVVSVPVEHGSWRNLTRSSGVADRFPTWSPDGSQVAWFNDDGGEYALVIGDAMGAERRRVSISAPTFYFRPTWSPDGSQIAFTDTDFRVRILDVDSGRVRDIGGELYADPRRSMSPSWSPGSRYLAYALRLENLFRAVFVYDTETGTTHQVTDGMADALSPVWDASGRYLHFLGSTNFAMNSGWLDMSAFDRPVTRTLYTVILEADAPSPYLPQSDEAQTAEAAEETAEDSTTVVIDFEGIQERIVDAPSFPTRNYQGLVRGPAHHVFVLESVPNRSGSVLHRYSLTDREAVRFQEGVGNVVSSPDGTHVMFRTGAAWRVAAATGGPPQAGEGQLDLSDLRVRVEPQAEWNQMLRDGWRFMRDFLYVDNEHGAPWDDVWDWYSAWLPDVQHRSDFNHLLDMVSGEIAVGHSYVRGGDYPEIPSARTGLLGADLELDGDRYRLARLYSGESWNPGLQGPLTQPGMGVRAGDYLVALDGRELRAPTNPYALLEGTAGRAISITVESGATGDRRTLVVEPVASENQLRTWAWVEGNRRRVDELSGGRLAYVWVPNTGQGGYTFFNRMYFAQQDRQGAVIDERNNGGGSAADYIVEVLDRELTGYFNSRTPSRRPFTQPMAAVWGPKVMVINERAGSGGDLLPYLFRFKGIGPLVGTKTWGGLVHTADTPPLIDGGRFVAPRGGFYDVNGEWRVEGEGVAPDIEVHNYPAQVMAGGDPQLEAAVEEALRLLRTQAVTLEPEPAAPVRYRRPDRRGGN